MIGAGHGAVRERRLNTTAGLKDELVQDLFVSTAALPETDAKALARGEIGIEQLELLAGWWLSFQHGDDPAVATALAPGQRPGVLADAAGRGVTGRHFTGRNLDFTTSPTE